jgi:hypothetical protein
MTGAMSDPEYLRNLDIVMANESGKLRSMELSAVVAMDIAFRPGASDSLQREEAALYDYIEPLRRRVNGYGAAAFFQFPFSMVPGPNIKWAGVAKGHLDTVKEIERNYSELRTAGLYDKWRGQAAVIRRMEQAVAQAEQSLIVQSLSAVDKLALRGLEFQRNILRTVDNVTGGAFKTAQVGLQEAGATAREGLETGQVAIEAGGEIVEQGIKTGGDVINNAIDEGGRTVRQGLTVWAIAGIAVLGILALILAPALRGAVGSYVPKGGAK